MGLVRWFIKKSFKKAWKETFGVEPEITDRGPVVDSIPAELEKLYGVRISDSIWDTIIDNINRLPRPLFTFWVFYLLLLPLFNIEKFRETMLAYAEFPDSLFYIVMTIIGFWFATKSLEKVKYFINPKEYKEKLLETELLRKHLKELQESNNEEEKKL